MNPKINAYFIIFLLLFSMYPVPITSAEFTDETNTVYEGKNFIGTIPSVANANQGYKFQIEDDLISWSIDSITTRTDVFGKVKEDKVGASSLNSSTSTYIDATPLFKSDINFKFTDNSMKQTIIIEKSDIDAQANYTYFTIDETILTTKSAENYYIDINTNEKVSWTAVNKITKDNIQAKELYFGNERLRLLKPIAYDENGNTINGYYEVKASTNNNFDIKTVFLKSDIDTLEGTIYFDPTIENGFTGTTTTTLTGLSGNQSISVPDGSSYDLNITNNQPSAWTINGTDFPKRASWTLNTTAENLTDIQVERATPYDSDMQPDMDDRQLTYYENDTLISFWDKAVINSTNATSYVKVPKTSTTEQQRYWLYYGNSTASSVSNGSDTFIQFDDFESYADTTALFASAKWSIEYGNPILCTTHVYSGSKGLEINGLDWAGWTIPDDDDYILDFEGRYDSIEADTWGLSGRDAGSQIIGTPYMSSPYWSGTSIVPAGEDVFHHFSILYENSNNSMSAWEDETEIYTDVAYSTGGAIDQVNFGRTLGYYDNVRIRQYTTTELTWLADGEEQTASGTVNITASVTGDSTEQSYNTSQSKEFTLTPTGETNNVLVNTTSTDYDVTLTTYWTDDTTLISQSASQGTALMFLNYTPSFDVNSGVINSTFDTGTIDFSAVDSVGVIKATQNDVNYTSNASRTGQDINVSVTNLTADQSYLFNFSILYNKNMTASVSEQSFSTTQDVSVVFTASDEDSNPLTISGILNGTTKTTTSPHNYGKLSAGTYTYYLNVTEDATINPHTENLTATINVIQNYGSVPSIHDGVYGYHYDTIPSESQILARQTDGLVTVDIQINFDTMNASTWTTIKSRISYAYDNNIRSSLHLDMNGAYTSQSYIDGVKSNISAYLSNLITDPYQSNTQFLTLNFTNTSASENDKVTFANTIGINISDSTNSKFKTITREQLTGLDTTWVDNTPIKYINLTTKSQWIDDEASNYRAATTKSRMYTGNTSFFNDITTYRNTQLTKARGSSDVGNQFNEISTVKLTNGDILFYNNDSSSQNMTIQSVTNGTYFDITNDVYFNLSADGELYFNLPAESIAYVLKDTFDKIVFEDNTTSELKTVSSDNEGIIDYGNTLNSSPLDSWMWGGANTDLKFEFYDPYYTKDNTFMIHYEWLNASLVTDYTPYDCIIIADQNGNEINSSFETTTNLYGYVAVSGYADNDAWYNSKTAEIDVWIDVYDTNIFLDGIDFAVGGTNFSSRFKDLVEYIRVTKDKKAIVNTYTAYEEFATYGDMVMKESVFSRWDGTVNNPTYSYENMTIEKERADYFTSHNIPVLGMSFGAVDDYSKQAFVSFAFAVLYGFDGENSWRYGQPNFQSQVELSIYPFGTMLEGTYTEHSPTDWSRLYSSGRVHINPIDHTYSIDNNLHVNSIKFNMSLYSGAEGSGDRNVYIYINDNTTPYIIPYDAGVDPVGVWQDKQIELSASEYNTTGHYNIYSYTLRASSGGWNTIGKHNITGIGTHTWLDETTENIPTTFENQTWVDVDMASPTAIEEDSNWMVSFSTNVTTSSFLDDIENKITQTNIDTTYNITTVVNSTEDYDIPFWSDVVTVTDTFINASTYFKAQNGTWVEAAVNTVTDTSANVIDWAYTTIDNKVYGVARQLVSATEFIYRYLFPDVETSQEVYTELLPTIQNLASTTDTDQIHFNWDDYNGADYFNISQMIPNVYFTNDKIILDGIKDSAFTNDAHTWIGDSPNPYTTYGREAITWVRNETMLSGYADGEDNDNFNNDDSFELMLDFTNNNLTTDDRKFILGEDGSVTAEDWTGSAWNPHPTNAQGVVIGGGTAGVIQYEMQIPISELTNFNNGSTLKFAMSRVHSGSNPDVFSYYPQTLSNDTDATLWDEITLSNETQYEYIDNTTISSYTVTGLEPFAWYKHKLIAINGVDESEPVYSIDTTLDTPSYTISGFIKDIFGNFIPNATVHAQNGYVSELNISDEYGEYYGVHFHNDTYLIYANATGYDINYTTAIVDGANLTNVNITLIESVSNYDNFTFTNAQVSPSTILEGKPFTVSVDINDSDGAIATAIVKIDGTNYTMTNSTGDTWTYIFSDTAIPTRYFVQNFYAQDNTSAWNSTTSTLSVIAQPSTGTGGFGGMPTDVPEPIPEEEPPEEELIPEEPTDIDSILDVLERKLSEATNITTIKNIFKSKAVAFIGVKYTVGDYSTTKDIVKPEALTCESTDPRVSCGVMDGVVTIIVMPTTDDSKLYQFTDTYVKITNNDLNVYHLPVSLSLINLMWYFGFNMDIGIENPYIVAGGINTDATVGLRGWWITVIIGLAILGFMRKYN